MKTKRFGKSFKICFIKIFVQVIQLAQNILTANYTLINCALEERNHFFRKFNGVYTSLPIFARFNLIYPSYPFCLVFMFFVWLYVFLSGCLICWGPDRLVVWVGWRSFFRSTSSSISILYVLTVAEIMHSKSQEYLKLSNFYNLHNWIIKKFTTYRQTCGLYFLDLFICLMVFPVFVIFKQRLKVFQNGQSK